MDRTIGIALALALGACAAPPGSVAVGPPASAAASSGPPIGAPPPARVDAPPVAPDPPPTGARAAEIARLARHAVSAFVNEEARFTADGKRVAYLSDRGGGARRAWLADPKRPEEPPVAIADLVDPVRAAVPVGDAVVLLAARADGDALLRVPLPKKPKPGAPARLDPPAPIAVGPAGRARRDEPIAIDGERPRIVVTERAEGEVASRVVEVPLATGKAPRVVAVDAEGGAIVGVDRAGRRGVLLRASGSIAVVDLAGGAPRAIALPAGTNARAAAIAPDGEAVVVGVAAPDGGGVIVLDAATGAERARSIEAGATIGGVAVAPEGDRLAVLVDRGDRAEVRLLDARSLARGPEVALPQGAGRLGRFSRDGRRVTVTWSTSSSPADVLAVDAKTGAATRLRDDVRAPLALFPSVESATARVPAGPGDPVAVVVHRPEGVAKGPAVVIAPGASLPPAALGFAAHARLLTGLGWAVVEVARAGQPARDLAAVGAWVASRPFVDPARVALLAGGDGALAAGAALAAADGPWAAVALVDPGDLAGARERLASVRAPLLLIAGAERAEGVVRERRARGGAVAWGVVEAGDPREARIATCARVAAFLEGR